MIYLYMTSLCRQAVNIDIAMMTMIILQDIADAVKTYTDIVDSYKSVKIPIVYLGLGRAYFLQTRYLSFCMNLYEWLIVSPVHWFNCHNSRHIILAITRRKNINNRSMLFDQTADLDLIPPPYIWVSTSPPPPPGQGPTLSDFTSSGMKICSWGVGIKIIKPTNFSTEHFSLVLKHNCQKQKEY